MVITQLIVAFRAIVAVIGLSGNLLVVVTVSVESRLHIMCDILLASLAVSDLLGLILTNTYNLDCMIQEKWLYSETMCYLLAFFSRYFYLNTVLHLVAVSYERYRAIVKEPFTYNGIMTLRKGTSLALLWIIPIPFCMGPFFGWGTYVYNPKLYVCEQGWTVQSDAHLKRLIFYAIFGLALPFLVISYLNWSVFKTARRVQQADLEIQHTLNQNKGQNEATTRKIFDRKAAVDVSFVVGAFLAFYIPLWIVNICRQFMKDVPIMAVKFTNAIYLVSSMANPIIYSIRKQAFRKSVKKMMRRMVFRCASNFVNDRAIVANHQGSLTRHSGETNAISIPSRPSIVSTGSSAPNGKIVDVNVYSRAVEMGTPSDGAMEISAASRTVRISTPTRPSNGNTLTSSLPEPLVVASAQQLRISLPLAGPIETLSASTSFQEPLTPGMLPVSVRSSSTTESHPNPIRRPSPSKYVQDQAEIPSTKTYHRDTISQRSSGMPYGCTRRFPVRKLGVQIRTSCVQFSLERVDTDRT